MEYTPSVGDWVVVRRSTAWSRVIYHDFAVIDSVKPKTVIAKVGLSQCLSRVSHDDLIAVADKNAAQLLLQRLESARSECDRRINAARQAYRAQLTRLYAQATVTPPPLSEE